MGSNPYAIFICLNTKLNMWDLKVVFSLRYKVKLDEKKQGR